jgi:hypothetical protein
MFKFGYILKINTKTTIAIISGTHWTDFLNNFIN